MNIASRAFTVSLPKPVAAHDLFVSKGVAFENQTEFGCCCLQHPLYLVVFLDEGRVFCLCHFASSFVCVSFRLWSICFITCLHVCQTTYTPSSGHKSWSNTEEPHCQAKETNKKKSAIWARGGSIFFNIRVEHRCRDFRSIFRWRHVSWDHSASVCMGSPDWRTIRVDTPKHIFSKTDLFEYDDVCT